MREHWILTLIMSTNPIHGSIAIVLPDLCGGGAERVSLSLAREFLQRSLGVTFVLMRQEGELLERLPDGAKVINLNASRVREVPAAFTRYLRKERPDAVIANMWPLTVMCIAGHWMAGSRARIILCDHCILSAQYAGRGPFHRALLRSSLATAYRLADRRIAVSAGVADDLSTLSAIARHKFDVIHNPTPSPGTPYARSEKIALEQWGKQRARRILTVGSLKAGKNHTLLIRAFAQLAQTVEVRLMLLGEGSLRGEIEAAARAEGIADKVVMPGFFPDPTPFYRSADLFVLSSDYEGFGNVIVEALACGTPVVSTDCPSGPAEILENGRFGRLVPVEDADALADAMREALSCEPDREALRVRAAEFSPEIAANKYLGLLFPQDSTEATGTEANRTAKT